MADDRGERLQIMLSEAELKAVDDWRFTKRMPSRAAAIRELLRRGLVAEGFASAAAGQKSENYGVIKTPAGDGKDSRDSRA
jgi:metal-responsive CopG/Arc/MetJ family transcriptional regulator